MNQLPPTITIDGPSGSGKGTISQLLAQKLGWHLLDSGAIYRILALAIIKHHLDPTNEMAITNLALNLDVTFTVANHNKAIKIILDNQEVTEEIRTEIVSKLASTIASMPQVRQALLARQRTFRKPPGLIADGRDMGTVVFPDAKLKIFLTASSQERAKRRHKQLLEKGIDAKLSAVITELAARDDRDTKRATSPLKPAPDAIIIDTTDLSITAVMLQILNLIQKRGLDMSVH